MFNDINRNTSVRNVNVFELLVRTCNEIFFIDSAQIVVQYFYFIAKNKFQRNFRYFINVKRQYENQKFNV